MLAFVSAFVLALAVPAPQAAVSLPVLHVSVVVPALVVPVLMVAMFDDSGGKSSGSGSRAEVAVLSMLYSNFVF